MIYFYTYPKVSLDYLILSINLDEPIAEPSDEDPDFLAEEADRLQNTYGYLSEEQVDSSDLLKQIEDLKEKEKELENLKRKMMNFLR